MKRLMLLLAVLALTVAPAAAQDVVKIGQIEAQTGANAIYGWMSSQGTALAVDEINKAGGFKVGNKTYKLQLIALDTRGEPKEATVQLKRLVEVDQAKFIFGPFLSNVFLAVRPYAAEFNGKLLMWGGATRIHDYVGTPGNEFLMRTWNWDAGKSGFGELMVDNLVKTTGAKKIAMLFQNDQGARCSRTSTCPCSSRRASSSRLDYFEPGTKDFSAVLAKIAAWKPDFLFPSYADSYHLRHRQAGHGDGPAHEVLPRARLPRPRAQEQGRHRGVHGLRAQVLRGGGEDGAQGGQVRQGLQGVLQARLPLRPGAALLLLLLRPRVHAGGGDEEGGHGGRSRRGQEGAHVHDLRRDVEDPLRREGRGRLQLRRRPPQEGRRPRGRRTSTAED